MSIHINKYYEVRVLDNDPDDFSYEVINIRYGVAEHKCHTLPAAIHVADKLEEELSKLIERPVSPVVSINKAH